MPAAGGKSLCYQIPAIIMDGVTLVVSPLISLMKDQVMALITAGVSAAYINSSLSPEQFKKAYRKMSAGEYKIVYVAPERLTGTSFVSITMNSIFLCLLSTKLIEYRNGGKISAQVI